MREATVETSKYHTDTELALEKISEDVLASSRSIEESLDVMSDTTEKASRDLRVIDEAQRSLHTIESSFNLEQTQKFEAFEIALASLTDRLLSNQKELVNSQQKVRELEEKVSTDALTKAGNRVALESCVQKHEKSKIPFAVVECDLNFFKMINDTFGHDAGDSVLQIFTNRVKGCLKQTDSVFRTGGDEFVIILSGIDSAEELKKVTARIHKTIVSTPLTLEGTEIPLSASLGGAVCDWKTIDTISAAFKVADKNVYRDKESIERAEVGERLRRIAEHKTGKDASSMFRR